MLIDTHCHIHDARFDEDRFEVIERARKSGISAMISIGCDLETTRRAKALAQTHRDIYFSAGFHPHEARLAPENMIEELRAFATHPKCLAIGECGLDFHYDHSPRDVQRRVFKNQMDLATEVNKALVIHVRDAFEECLEMLSNFSAETVPVVIHCFTGTLQIAAKFLELGCYISISGIVTFKDPGELNQVIAMAPIGQLLVETDSPYLAPMPYRGKRNEPSYVVSVAEKVAQLKSLDFAETCAILTNTSRKVFKLSGAK